MWKSLITLEYLCSIISEHQKVKEFKDMLVECFAKHKNRQSTRQQTEWQSHYNVINRSMDTSGH